MNYKCCFWSYMAYSLDRRLFVVIFAVSGCSSMTSEECLKADWYQVGYSDGVGGRNPNIIRSYQNDCKDVNVIPEYQQWLNGFERGTVLYCSPDNGYKVGYSGRTYHGVCDNNFLYKYELGKNARLRDDRLKEIDFEIRRLTDKINSTSKDKRKEIKRLKEDRKELIYERTRLITPSISYEFNF